MANSDGSLKFDTQLDNSGFEKGADKIQRNLDSIKASAEQVNAASSRAAQAVAGQFQHMASDAPEAASAMLGLNDAMKNIADGMSTSAGRSAAQMQSAAQQTAQAALSRSILARIAAKQYPCTDSPADAAAARMIVPSSFEGCKTIRSNFAMYFAFVAAFFSVKAIRIHLLHFTKIIAYIHAHVYMQIIQR